MERDEAITSYGKEEVDLQCCMMDLFKSSYDSIDVGVTLKFHKMTRMSSDMAKIIKHSKDPHIFH